MSIGRYELEYRIELGLCTASVIVLLVLSMLWMDGCARRRHVYEMEARARERAAASAQAGRQAPWRDAKWEKR